MQLESKNDLRLVGRAMKEGWDFDRSKVVSALMELVERRDPDLMLDAISLLQKGDELNIKRELMELKKLGDENHMRLRLIELARNAGITGPAEPASQDGLVSARIDG